MVQQPACVNEGVFLERLLAGRCKPFHNMVPLIQVTCSLWELQDHVGCRRSWFRWNQREDDRVGRGRKQGPKTPFLVSVGRRQVGREAVLQQLP